MGYYIAVPILAILTALQSTAVPQMRLNSGQPDFIFLVVMAWAARAPLPEGIFWAFVGGILSDLLSVTPLGTSVIGMVLVVFALKSLEQQLFGVGIFFLLALALAGTVLQEGISLFVVSLMGLGVPLLQFAEFLLLPTLFYHLLLILPVYFIVRRIQKRLPQTRS